MNYRKTDSDEYLLRFYCGEEVYQGITDFCKKMAISNATVMAIGALSEAELGYYHINTKTYSWKVFQGDYELVSALGNIILLNETPFLHMHVVLGDTDFRAFGGHLRKGFAGATCEVVIREMHSGNPIERLMDQQIGLNLWACGEKG